MAPQRSRSRRGRRGGEAGTLVLAVALVFITLLAGGVGVYVWATANRPALRDQRTFCPLTGPSAITVMLLDTSDPLPAATREDVRTRLTDIVNELPDNALLEIRVLDPAVKSGRSVFSLCNPGDGRGLSEFTANPSLAKRRWREKFKEPVDQALNGALLPQRSETSPILSTLQGIALERFAGNSNTDIPKSLVIVSDMIEYGKEYSQYSQADLSYDRFRKSPLYLKVRTDLNAAEVRLLYVDRLTGIKSADHMKFWANWVADNGGKLTRITRLQGAGKS